VFGLFSIIASGYHKKQKLHFYLSLLFFLYWGISLSISKESFLLGVVQAFVMLTIALYLLSVDIKRIEFVSKTLVTITFLLSLLGYYVFIIYAVYPEYLNIESYDIASSVTGNSDIIVGSYLDYLSFTSGEGFTFFGNIVTRVKGYSNEPSSTLVHYLAPAVFALMYSKKYKAMGGVIILFSLIAISSLMGVIAVFLSAPIYALFLIKNNKIKVVSIVLSVFGLAILMLYVDQVVQTMIIYGNDLNAQTSYDLIARKQGSATARLQDYNHAISLIFNYPFGFSAGNSGTGLWTQIALAGGVVMLSIYFLFSYKVLSISSSIFNRIDSVYKKFGVALLVALWIVSFLITAYGWDRIPGVIILILFYRIVSYEYNNQKLGMIVTSRCDAYYHTKLA